MALPQQVPALIDGRYTITGILGSGGMGTVFRATDRLTGADVALKQMRTAEDEKPGDTFSTDTFLSISHEFKMLASLRHPNIISVLDYGFIPTEQPDDFPPVLKPYFTMTLLDSPQTITEAARGQPMDVKVNLILQILQALVYLHRRQIFHRDLKPGNVLVVDDHVYVLDFGLAADTEEPTDAAVGTLAYMAPDVLQGGPPTAGADLYAVGVMLYELLSGHHPYAGQDVTELIQSILLEPIPLNELDVNPELGGVLWGLLAKDPEERYQDAYSVITELCRATQTPLPEETREIRESYIQAAHFVGRARELARLREAVNVLTMPVTGETYSRRQLWLVSGESGVGKSRLIDETAIRAMIQGVRVVRGQAVNAGGRVFELWREIVRHLSLQVTLESEELVALAEFVPDIYRLQGQTLPEDELVISPERIKLAVDSLFRQVLEKGPLLLILEDVQWATSESLSLVTMAKRLPEHLPLMILASFRNDEHPQISEEFSDFQRLDLHRLERSEISRLSHSMLGERGKLPDVVDLLNKETEGNVFFIVEVVRALAEEAGRLSEVGLATLPEHVFTGGVNQVVQRRLNRVPEWARPPLDYAAVAGRAVDSLLIQAIYPDLDIIEWVNVCTNAAIFDEQVRFAHDKLREAVLDALTPPELEIIHQRVAEAIENAYADSLDEYAHALYVHWANANNAQKEAHYAVIAADQFRDVAHFHEARRLLERALALKEYEQHKNPDARQAELRLLLANTAYELSELDESYRLAEQALAYYRVVDDTLGIADCYAIFGQVALRRNHNQEALPWVEQSLALYRQIDNKRQIAGALRNLGIIYWQINEDLQKVYDVYQESVEIMRGMNDPLSLARSLNNFGNVVDEMGNREEAIAVHNEALEIRRRINHRQGVAYSLINLGVISDLSRDYETARTQLVEALSVLREVGDRIATTTTLNALGTNASHLKRYDDARRYYEESRDLAQEYEDLGGVAHAINGLGQVSVDEGKLVEATQHHLTALKMARENDLQRSVMGAIRGMADIYRAKKDYSRAYPLLVMIRKAYPYMTEGLDQDLETMDDVLSEEVRQLLRQQGETWDMNTVADEILTTAESSGES